MKISFINGSPKSGTSCSGALLNQLQKDILDKAGANVSSEDFAAYRINITPLSDTDVAEIAESDIIVVAFPLYVDGIPSHMLAAITEYINAKFTDAIQRGIEMSLSNPKNLMIELGKEYVGFFADNPYYFSYIFESADKNIVLTDTDFAGDYAPFILFRNAAVQLMEQAEIPKEHYRDNIIVMWAVVHGIAAMANMKAFHYEGDWRALTEIILREKINIC